MTNSELIEKLLGKTVRTADGQKLVLEKNRDILTREEYPYILVKAVNNGNNNTIMAIPASIVLTAYCGSAFSFIDNEENPQFNFLEEEL